MTVRAINLNHFRMKLAGVGMDVFGYNRAHIPEDPNTDAWDYRSESRIQTPYDKLTAEKANLAAGRGLPDEEQRTLLDMMSDDAYSDDPVDRRLTREQLGKIHEIYSKVDPSNPSAQYLQPFMSKIKHLQEDPTMQYARLEWQ